MAHPTRQTVLFNTITPRTFFPEAMPTTLEQALAQFVTTHQPPTHPLHTLLAPRPVPPMPKIKVPDCR